MAGTGHGDWKVLYTSQMMRKAIEELFSAPEEDDRRVAMVAYVGGEADTYLPDPDNLEIICALQPGATSAVTLGLLKLAGAVLFQSDRLHMKVYWSSRKGCVIGSANASGNGLGDGGSKEAGVWLPPGAVDIHALWRYAQPRPIRGAHLKKLAASEPPRKPGERRPSDPKRTLGFLEWTVNEGGTPWKLGWWSGGGGPELASAAREEVELRTGLRDPEDFMLAASGQIGEEDWLLSFDIDTLKVAGWFHADLVHDVARTNRAAYSKYWPCQAIMFYPARSYGKPPFKIDRDFRTAFAAAVTKFGAATIWKNKSLVPSPRLIRLIKESWPAA